MADYSIDVRNSGTVDVESDVHLDGLDDVKVASTVNATGTLNSDSDVTVHSDGTARLTLDPVATTSAIALDLEPVAVDSCVRVELAPVAPTMVRSPWEQRVGFSILGIELAAVSWCGEATTYVEPVPPRPLVVGPTRTRPGPDHEHGHDRPAGGVQIRVGS